MLDHASLNHGNLALRKHVMNCRSLDLTKLAEPKGREHSYREDATPESQCAYHYLSRRHRSSLSASTVAVARAKTKNTPEIPKLSMMSPLGWCPNLGTNRIEYMRVGRS